MYCAAMAAAVLSSHTDQAKALVGGEGQLQTQAERNRQAEALGPQGLSLPAETQQNNTFIKKVAEKLHIRSRDTDTHPQHRRTEARRPRWQACACMLQRAWCVCCPGSTVSASLQPTTVDLHPPWHLCTAGCRCIAATYQVGW